MLISFSSNPLFNVTTNCLIDILGRHCTKNTESVSYQLRLRLDEDGEKGDCSRQHPEPMGPGFRRQQGQDPCQCKCDPKVHVKRVFWSKSAQTIRALEILGLFLA